MYKGNGRVVESVGVHSGVIESAIGDRGWTEWGKCWLVDYAVVPSIDWEAESKRLAIENAAITADNIAHAKQYTDLKAIVDEYNSASRKLLEV